MICTLIIFFYKQKTAYESRISDWSSDVCSSDLILRAVDELHRAELRAVVFQRQPEGHAPRAVNRESDVVLMKAGRTIAGIAGFLGGRKLRREEIREVADADMRATTQQLSGAFADARSEEHTSELQSLMRISYAVSCFNKKTIQIIM